MRQATFAVTPDRSITESHDRTTEAFALALTTYALQASPERVAQMMRQAYGDHGPDSAKRWREQQALRQQGEQQARDRAGKGLYRRVHTVPVGVVLIEQPAPAPRGRAAKRCENCGGSYLPLARVASRQRFCSKRCRRGAARLREMAAERVVGDPRAVDRECRAALSRLRAIVVAAELQR